MTRGSSFHGAPARAVLCAVATVALLGPVGAVAHADEGPDEPLVERIALTDDQGDLTSAGESGLEADGAASTLSSADAAGEVATDEPSLLTLPVETEVFYVAALTWSADSAVTEDLGFLVRVLEPAGWSDWSELDVEDGAETDSPIMGSDPFVASGATAVQVQVRGDAELPADLTLALIPDNATGDAAVQTEVPGVAAVQPEPTLEPAAPAPDESTVVEPDAESTPTAPEPADGAADDSTGDQAGAPDGTTPAVPGPDASDAPTAGSEPSAAPTEPATDEPTAEPTAGATDEATAGISSPGTPGSRSVMSSAPAPTPTDRGAATNNGVISPSSLPILGNPGVRTRAAWGADERMMTWNPRRADLQAAVVHHTAGSNTYTQAQVPAIIRSIYRYHAVTRDWGDIGYNILVDRFGQAWEGRSGTLSSPVGQMVIGGHARPMNTHTLGISVMGTYTQMRASSSVMTTMANVLAWQFARAGLSMDSGSGLTSSGTGSTSNGREMPRIFGHQAASLTACPGQIQGQLGDLTRMVRERQPLMNYLNNRWTGTADVQFRYGERNAQTFVGDWDGDGRDTLATRVGNQISVSNANSYSAPTITFWYGRPGDVLLVGDWNGDGKDTFAVRRGNAYHIRNSLTPGAADVVVRYGKPTDAVLAGDWNGDGRDTLAVRRGNTYHFRNSLTTGRAEAVARYGKSTDAVLAGDWNGDGRDTLAVRRGNSYYLSNSLTSTRADRVTLYGRSTDTVIVGDWNRDGTDTLGVVRRP